MGPILIQIRIDSDKVYSTKFKKMRQIKYALAARLMSSASSLVCLFGWVLWHINHYKLFNAKSSLDIFIKYIRFGLVWFYSISSIVGHFMSNPFYTYILNACDLV